MPFLMLITTLLLIWPWHTQAATQLCPHIQLLEGKLSLNANEKVMICGKENGSEAWQEIPLTQSEYQLKIYLQQEGYLNPRFERLGNKLQVWSGPISTTKELLVQGASQNLIDPTRKRKIIGQALTPSKLNEVNQWAETQLRIQGYACPNIGVQAQMWNDSIIVVGEPGKQKKISLIDSSGLSELNSDVIHRYQAFQIGDSFDIRKVQISSGRMLADGLVQSAYYITRCNEQGAELRLQGNLGPPRLFRFEIGASTEEFPFTNIIFRNTRMDEYASSYTLRLSLSPLQQSIRALSQLYLLPWDRSSYLGPRVQFSRVSEDLYEYFESKAGIDLGKHFDSQNIRWSWKAGPTFNRLETLKGIGPDKKYFLTWEASLHSMNHNYEYSLADQYEGWESGIKFLGQTDALASDINANRIDVNFKHLWNLGLYSPPLFVLGLRLELSAIDADLSNDLSKDLPTDYRIFYGGSENMRGFARKSLHNQDRGYSNSAYAGLELRWIEQLPWRLQPLILIDAAQLGEKRYKLDSPIYLSNGFGLRWGSPFGAIRGSLAKGDILNANSSTDSYARQWMIFLSFGQEF